MLPLLLFPSSRPDEASVVPHDLQDVHGCRHHLDYSPDVPGDSVGQLRRVWLGEIFTRSVW